MRRGRGPIGTPAERIGPEALRLRTAPLAFAAVWFAAGIAVGSYGWRPSVLLLAAVIACCGLSVVALRKAERVAWLPVAALWVVAGITGVQWQTGTPLHAALQPYADGLSRRVMGRISQVRVLPRVADADADRDFSEASDDESASAAGLLQIDVALEGVEAVTADRAWIVPMSGGVRLTLGDAGAAASGLACGASIDLPVRMHLPVRYGDPGVFQYADYLGEQGIAAVGTASARELARLQVLSAPPTWREAWRQGRLREAVRCGLARVQAWSAARVEQLPRTAALRWLPKALRLNADDTAMMAAMLFGDRSRLDGALRLGFERTATFHLFVVSGVHVALLAGLLLWCFAQVRIVGRRMPQVVSTLSVLGLITAYAALTGMAPPVERALVMTAVYLLARLLSRDQNALQALGAAALAILVAEPRVLWTASFGMTMLVLVAIAGLAGPLAEWSFAPYARAAKRLEEVWRDAAMAPRMASFRVLLRVWVGLLQQAFGEWLGSAGLAALRGLLWVAELWLAGLVVELVMALPMALYFHRLTPMAQPANLLLLPLIGPVLVAALVTFLASLAGPWVAMGPSVAAAVLLHGTRAAVGWFGSRHGADWRVPGPPMLAAGLAIFSWVALCWLVRRSRRAAWLAVGALPLVALMLLWPYRPVLLPGRLEVSAIDVGQGDSILVAGPDGRTMLVDAGGPVGRDERASLRGSGRWEIGEQVVSPVLWSRRLRRLDVVVLTHAHSDHMGGMPAVLRNLRPRELWVGVDPDSTDYRALLQEASALGIQVRHLHAGDRPGFGATDVRVLAPSAAYANHGAPSNGDSVVLQLQYGKASVLLEGDAESATERELVAQGVGPVTLLKVGHHGSLTSTTPAFAAAVRPAAAVVSVGRGNSFGHPRFEVISRLAAQSTKLYRTDEFGMVRFLLAADGSIVERAGVSPPDEESGP